MQSSESSKVFIEFFTLRPFTFEGFEGFEASFVEGSSDAAPSDWCKESLACANALITADVAVKMF